MQLDSFSVVSKSLRIKLVFSFLTSFTSFTRVSSFFFLSFNDFSISSSLSSFGPKIFSFYSSTIVFNVFPSINLFITWLSFIVIKNLPKLNECLNDMISSLWTLISSWTICLIWSSVKDMPTPHYFLISLTINTLYSLEVGSKIPSGRDLDFTYFIYSSTWTMLFTSLDTISWTRKLRYWESASGNFDTALMIKDPFV